ncbi:MAG: MFS transporter [Firmicutes bacterium]|jgi:FSR family fosmidomycin resistance protein-like MFS transporter|nr:MFS transporter [Bacillota bacterium]MDH7496337.1 MFS transporter [Bacillota bacterium]
MRKRLELAAVTCGHFTNDLYAAFLTPLLPMLVARFEMSLAMAGLLSAAYATTSSLVQPLVGHLADTSGSRAFIVLGPLITATAMCAIGLAGSEALLVVLLILGGIGSGMFHPQGAAMAGSIDQTRKGFMLSAFTTAGELGYALGPLVLLSVVSTLGIGHTYVTALPGVLVSLFIYRFAPKAPARRPRTRTSGPRSRRGDRGDPGRVGVETPSFHHSNGTVGDDASRGEDAAVQLADRDRSVPARALAMLWVIATLRLSVSTSFTTFLPIYLKEMGLPLVAYGSVASMFMFAGTAGIMIAGPVADRVGSFRLMTVAWLASLPLLLGFLHVKGPVSYALLAAGGIMLYAPMPVITMIAQDLAPARAGTVSAFMMGVAWGAGSLGAAGVGVMADALGIRIALTLVLAVLVVAAALTRALERQTRMSYGRSLSTAHEPTCR